MTLTFTDQSTLALLGAQGTEEYISGQRSPAVRFIFDGTTNSDPALRKSFSDTEKTKIMTIDDGTPLEGYTVLVRTIYEDGKIKVIMAKNMDTQVTELQEQVAAQQEAISILMGGTNNGGI